MCALCGVLGGEEHWSAGVRGADVNQTRRAARLAQVRAANAVLGVFAMRLDDWQGAAFVLSGPTGRREILDALPAVWEMAGSMLGGVIDPLDPGLIDRIAERAGV